MQVSKAQIPQIQFTEVIEIGDSVGVQDSDVIVVEPCPTPTPRVPLKISYKAGCASVLAKYSYPDYYPSEFDLTELATQLIRRHGYRITRRYDHGNYFQFFCRFFSVFLLTWFQLQSMIQALETP